jgi:hypothetical protein
MLVGYARVSTVEQDAGFAAQLEELNRTCCEKVFSERVSSVAVVAHWQSLSGRRHWIYRRRCVSFRYSMKGLLVD